MAKVITIQRRYKSSQQAQSGGGGETQTSGGGGGGGGRGVASLAQVLGVGNKAINQAIVFKETENNNENSITIDENGNIVITGNLHVQGDIAAFAEGLTPGSWWDELSNHTDGVTIEYVNGKLQVKGGSIASDWGTLQNKPSWLSFSTLSAFQTGHTHDYSNLTGKPDLSVYLLKSGGAITGDLSISGNLTVSGTQTVVDTETLAIQDNIILINRNQTGTPPTTLKGGIEVERGSLTNYQFVFDEANDAFKVGMIGDLQPVATREETPTNGGFAVWNAAANRFDTQALNASVIGASLQAVTDVGATTTNTIRVQSGSDYGEVKSSSFRGNRPSFYFANDFDGGNLQFQTTGTTRLTILSNGNVGIGTTSPTQKLEISDGNIRITNSGGIIRSGFTSDYALLSMWDDSKYIIAYDSNYSAQPDEISLKTNSAGAVSFYVGSRRMEITNTGTTATGFLTATGEITAYSDRRLKKNIETLPGGTLDKIMQLNPVSFKRKDQKGNKKQIGLIAQELKKVFPEFVSKSGGFYSVNYSQITAILIKAIQELNEKIK